MKIELEVIKQIDEEKLAEAKEYVDKNRNISGEIDNIIAKRNRNNDIFFLFSLLQLVCIIALPVLYIERVGFSDIDYDVIFKIIAGTFLVFHIFVHGVFLAPKANKYSKQIREGKETLEKVKMYEKYILNVAQMDYIVVFDLIIKEGRFYIIYKVPGKEHISVAEFKKKDVQICDDKEKAEIYLSCSERESAYISQVIIPYGYI